MTESLHNKKGGNLRSLPRNVWAVSITSFFMDISSEMVINLLPLFLYNVLGVRTSVIGLIEGIAESTASLLKLFSGWISDRLRARKWLAVSGYAISALSKPFFYFADTWQMVASVRWIDRVGKGIRTAPRDALIADSVQEQQRGLAFGFHRAADTTGALVGLLIALGVVWIVQANASLLAENTFRLIVLISLIPAALAVLVLILGAKDVSVGEAQDLPKFGLRSLGKPFAAFILITSLFEIGNSTDAFLILRAQERGMSVIGILSMLAAFSLVYTLSSTPAGSLSDRIGRRRIIIAGWLFYALVYLGFGISQVAWQVWVLYAFYGLYYGLAYGTLKAMIADLVSEHVRATAYGTYNAVIGVLDFPASLIAGILWGGIGIWTGFGAAAPFLFGAATALLAAGLMTFWMPAVIHSDSQAAHRGY